MGVVAEIKKLQPKEQIRAWLDDAPGPMVWIMAYGPAVWGFIRTKIPFLTKEKKMEVAKNGA